MEKIQIQGIHHITLVGADRQTSIDFWEGVLGMPFVFEQPNLDVPEESHLYFDPGDGNLITVFTSEDRKPDPSATPEEIGSVHHLALNVSRATFDRAKQNLEARGVSTSAEIDRGFMWSIYFRDPLGFRIELATYKFELPPNITAGDFMLAAHEIRVAEGARNIEGEHLAKALERVTRERTRSLSSDRAPKNPYQ